MSEGSQSLHGNSKNMIECAVRKRNLDANRIALNTSELPSPADKQTNRFVSYRSLRPFRRYVPIRTLFKYCMNNVGLANT